MKFFYFSALFLAQSLTAKADTLFADGGYQSEPFECVGEWTYKEKLPDLSNLETSLTGCVSIEDFKPFPYYDEADAAEIGNLLEPTDKKTDKKMWCPVLRDVYNPTPQRNQANKFNWGFCLDISTEAPTASPEEEETSTSAPTVPEEEATEAPTEAEFEATEAPTFSEVEATEAPTKGKEEEEEESPNDEESNTASTLIVLDDWTVIGLGIAAALLLVAVVLGLLLVAKLRKKEDVIIDESDSDLEENSASRS